MAAVSLLLCFSLFVLSLSATRPTDSSALLTDLDEEINEYWCNVRELRTECEVVLQMEFCVGLKFKGLFVRTILDRRIRKYDPTELGAALLRITCNANELSKSDASGVIERVNDEGSPTTSESKIVVAASSLLPSTTDALPTEVTEETNLFADADDSVEVTSHGVSDDGLEVGNQGESSDVFSNSNEIGLEVGDGSTRLDDVLSKEVKKHSDADVTRGNIDQNINQGGSDGTDEETEHFNVTENSSEIAIEVTEGSNTSGIGSNAGIYPADLEDNDSYFVLDTDHGYLVIAMASLLLVAVLLIAIFVLSAACCRSCWVSANAPTRSNEIALTP